MHSVLRMEEKFSTIALSYGLLRLDIDGVMWYDFVRLGGCFFQLSVFNGLVHLKHTAFCIIVLEVIFGRALSGLTFKPHGNVR